VTITKIPLTLLGTQTAEKDGHRFTYVAANNAIELVSPTDAVFSIPDPQIVAPIQGSAKGYTSGGYSTSVLNTVDSFPFTSDTNASDVGDLTLIRMYVAGQSSDADGYSSGGFSPGDLNVIDKFPFSSNTNASDVGDLSQARYGTA